MWMSNSCWPLNSRSQGTASPSCYEAVSKTPLAFCCLSMVERVSESRLLAGRAAGVAGTGVLGSSSGCEADGPSVAAAAATSSPSRRSSCTHPLQPFCLKQLPNCGRTLARMAAGSPANVRLYILAPRGFRDTLECLLTALEAVHSSINNHAHRTACNPESKAHPLLTA
jgi:hypothetical protein